MLPTEFANKLRVSGPELSPEAAASTRRALERARWSTDCTVLTGLIWWLFQEAMVTHQRLPDRERSYLAAGERVAWPEVRHTEQEKWEADLQRIIDIRMSKEEPPLPRFSISDPTAIDRMLTVLSWLQFAKGKNIRRDVQAFLALAKGVPPRFVRQRYFHGGCADSTLRMMKDRVLHHISLAIEDCVAA